MASVVFLYRSTKDSACLTARLLFRLDKKDFILALPKKMVLYSKDERELFNQTGSPGISS